MVWKCSAIRQRPFATTNVRTSPSEQGPPTTVTRSNSERQTCTNGDIDPKAVLTFRKNRSSSLMALNEVERVDSHSSWEETCLVTTIVGDEVLSRRKERQKSAQEDRVMTDDDSN